MHQNQQIPVKANKENIQTSQEQSTLFKNDEFVTQKIDRQQSQVQLKDMNITGEKIKASIKDPIISESQITKIIDQDTPNKYTSAFYKKSKANGYDLSNIQDEEQSYDHQISRQLQSLPLQVQDQTFINQQEKFIDDDIDQIVDSLEQDKNQSSDLLIKKHLQMKKKRNQQIQAVQQLLQEDFLHQGNAQDNLIQNQQPKLIQIIQLQKQQKEIDLQKISLSYPLKRPQLYTFSLPVLDVQIVKSFYPGYKQKLPEKNQIKKTDDLIHDKEQINHTQTESKQYQQDILNSIEMMQKQKAIDLTKQNNLHTHQVQNDLLSQYVQNNIVTNHQSQEQQDHNIEIIKKDKLIEQFMKTQKQLEQISVHHTISQQIRQVQYFKDQVIQKKMQTTNQQKQPTLNQQFIVAKQQVNNEESQLPQQQSTIKISQIKDEVIKHSQAKQDMFKNQDIYPLSINLKETTQIGSMSNQIQNQKQNDSIFAEISAVALSKAKSLKNLQLSKLQSIPPTLSTSYLTHSNLNSQISNQQKSNLINQNNAEAPNNIFVKSSSIQKPQLHRYNPFMFQAIKIHPFFYPLYKQRIPIKSQTLPIQILNQIQQFQQPQQPLEIQLISNIQTSPICICPDLKNIQIIQQNLNQTSLITKKLQKIQFLSTSSKPINPSKLQNKFNIQPDYDTNIQSHFIPIPLQLNDSHIDYSLIENFNTQTNGKILVNKQIQYQTYAHISYNPRSIKSNNVNYFGSANTIKNPINSELAKQDKFYNLPSSRWTYQQVIPAPSISFCSQDQQISILNPQQPIDKLIKQQIKKQQKISVQDRVKNTQQDYSTIKMQKRKSHLELTRHHRPIHLRPSSKKKRQIYQSQKDFVVNRQQSIEKPSGRIKTQAEPFIQRINSPPRNQKIKVTQNNTKSPFQRKTLKTEPIFISPQKQISPYNLSNDIRDHQLQQKKDKHKIAITLRQNLNPSPPLSYYQESQIQLQYKADESPIRCRIN